MIMLQETVLGPTARRLYKKRSDRLSNDSSRVSDENDWEIPQSTVEICSELQWISSNSQYKLWLASTINDTFEARCNEQIPNDAKLRHYKRLSRMWIDHENDLVTFDLDRFNARRFFFFFFIFLSPHLFRRVIDLNSIDQSIRLKIRLRRSLFELFIFNSSDTSTKVDSSSESSTRKENHFVKNSNFNRSNDRITSLKRRVRKVIGENRMILDQSVLVPFNIMIDQTSAESNEYWRTHCSIGNEWFEFQCHSDVVWRNTIVDRLSTLSTE